MTRSPYLVAPISSEYSEAEAEIWLGKRASIQTSMINGRILGFVTQRRGRQAGEGTFATCVVPVRYADDEHTSEVEAG